MAETFMAGFGQGFVETQILTENNSIKYKLSIAASNQGSVPSEAYIRLNDKQLSPIPFQQGMNVWEYNTITNTIENRKIFNLSQNNSSSENTAFVIYMKSLVDNSKAYFLTTFGTSKSSVQVDDWFTSAGSVNFLRSDILDRYNGSYVGIYIPSHKKIVKEAACYTDGTQFDSRAIMEFVYDDISDIGATGFPYRVLYDTTETSKDNTNEIYIIPGRNGIAPIADGLMKPLDVMNLGFNLFASAAVMDYSATSTVRATITWYTGAASIQTNFYDVPKMYKNFWYTVNRYIVIPEQADGYSFSVKRIDTPEDFIGAAKVRNIIFGQVSKKEKLDLRNAAFGVNGIQTARLKDADTISELLVLPDLIQNPEQVTKSHEFRERPL